MPGNFPLKLKLRRTVSRAAGFTLVELLIVVAIIATLAALAIPAYQNFVGKAKITVAQTTLSTVRDTLLISMNETNSSYPTAINFTTGADDQGRIIFSQSLLDQINKDLLPSSLNYTGNIDGFTLTAQANDANHTVLILTQNSLTIQGI